MFSTPTTHEKLNEIITLLTEIRSLLLPKPQVMINGQPMPMPGSFNCNYDERTQKHHDCKIEGIN